MLPGTERAIIRIAEQLPKILELLGKISTATSQQRGHTQVGRGKWSRERFVRLHPLTKTNRQRLREETLPEDAA